MRGAMIALVLFMRSQLHGRTIQFSSHACEVCSVGPIDTSEMTLALEEGSMEDDAVMVLGVLGSAHYAQAHAQNDEDATIMLHVCRSSASASTYIAVQQ